MGEVYAMEKVISLLHDYNISWVIHSVPYNNDLRLFNPERILGRYPNVSVRRNAEGNLKERTYGFVSDISWKCHDDIIAVLDVQEVAASIDINPATSIVNEPIYDIVVSNVKLFDKNPSRECDPNIWELLWRLPYSIAVVPRHPLSEESLSQLPAFPENIVLINKMGILRDLYTRTRLVVMGLIFSNQMWETEHNPLEATVWAHAIYGKHLGVSPFYSWLYEKSWLLHGYANFSESIMDIWKYLEDPELAVKLAWRKKWIEENKLRLEDKLKTLFN